MTTTNDWTSKSIVTVTKRPLSLQEQLDSVPTSVRSVEVWNELREGFKEDFNPQVISDLDASGYIVKWLCGE